MQGQDWDAERYGTTAAFVADLAGEIFAWLDPKRGERILDLGCGNGRLTERIASAGAEVVGIDSSVSMVEAARARGLDARVGDARWLAFSDEFDAVFSNAVLHWVKEQDDALSGVRKALNYGGRFVAEMGGHGNMAAAVTALRTVIGRRGYDADPWYFPTAAEYEGVLSRHGFEVRRVETAARPTPLEKGMDNWLEFFGEPFLSLLPPDDREAAVREVLNLLRPCLLDSGGTWWADYVRLRFIAVKSK